MRSVTLALLLCLGLCSTVFAGEPLDESLFKSMFGKQPVAEDLFIKMLTGQQPKHACDCGPACKCGDDCKCGEASDEESLPGEKYLDMFDEIADSYLVQCPGGACPTNMSPAFRASAGFTIPEVAAAPGATITVPAVSGAPVSAGGYATYTSRRRFTPARSAARFLFRPFARMRDRAAARRGC